MKEPKKFVKKPVIIEAMQWTGDNQYEISKFIGDELLYIEEGKLLISTLEGVHAASINDWVIKGIKNEKYPCKPDIFEQTYEEIGE